MRQKNSVVVSEVSSFQSMQEWYLGWEKVSSVQVCPHRERGSIYHTDMDSMYICVCVYIKLKVCVWVYCSIFASRVSL